MAKNKKKHKNNTRNQSWEDFKTILAACAFVGIVLGVLIGLYMAICHIRPALLDVGFSSLQADLATGAIAIFGELEIAAALGVGIGLVKAFVYFHLLYLPYVYCRQGAYAAGEVCEAISDGVSNALLPCSPTRIIERLRARSAHSVPSANNPGDQQNPADEAGRSAIDIESQSAYSEKDVSRTNESEHSVNEADSEWGSSREEVEPDQGEGPKP